MDAVRWERKDVGSKREWRFEDAVEDVSASVVDATGRNGVRVFVARVTRRGRLLGMRRCVTAATGMEFVQDLLGEFRIATGKVSAERAAAVKHCGVRFSVVESWSEDNPGRAIAWMNLPMGNSTDAEVEEMFEEVRSAMLRAMGRVGRRQGRRRTAEEKRTVA